jgi:hypothetical protein
MRDTLALALVRAELCRVYAEKQPEPPLRRTGRGLHRLFRKAWRRRGVQRTATPVR